MKKIILSDIVKALLIMNIVCFVYGFIRYGLWLTTYDAINLGALLPVLVTDFNQYWRLISANFVHFDLLHLLMNCYALVQIGTFVELVFKKKGMILIVVLSMLSTTCIPTLLYMLGLSSKNVVMGGFSGVLCGMLGALLLFTYLNRTFYERVYKQLLFNVQIILVLSFIPSVSLIGHVSGMLGGLLSVLIMIQYNKVKKRRLL